MHIELTKLDALFQEVDLFLAYSLMSKSSRRAGNVGAGNISEAYVIAELSLCANALGAYINEQDIAESERYRKPIHGIAVKRIANAFHQAISRENSRELKKKKANDREYEAKRKASSDAKYRLDVSTKKV